MTPQCVQVRPTFVPIVTGTATQANIYPWMKLPTDGGNGMTHRLTFEETLVAEKLSVLLAYYFFCLLSYHVPFGKFTSL